MTNWKTCRAMERALLPAAAVPNMPSRWPRTPAAPSSGAGPGRAGGHPGDCLRSAHGPAGGPAHGRIVVGIGLGGLWTVGKWEP